MKKQCKTLQIDGVKNTLVMDVLPKFTTKRRHVYIFAERLLIGWFVMVEHDSELREVFLEISIGQYNGCSHHEIQKHIQHIFAVAIRRI